MLATLVSELRIQSLSTPYKLVCLHTGLWAFANLDKRLRLVESDFGRWLRRENASNWDMRLKIRALNKVNWKHSLVARGGGGNSRVCLVELPGANWSRVNLKGSRRIPFFVRPIAGS